MQRSNLLISPSVDILVYVPLTAYKLQHYNTLNSRKPTCMYMFSMVCLSYTHSVYVRHSLPKTFFVLKSCAGIKIYFGSEEIKMNLRLNQTRIYSHVHNVHKGDPS